MGWNCDMWLLLIVVLHTTDQDDNDDPDTMTMNICTQFKSVTIKWYVIVYTYIQYKYLEWYVFKESSMFPFTSQNCK